MSTFTDHTEIATDHLRAAVDKGSSSLRRRGWRKITWVMIAWAALLAVGCLIALGSGGHEIAECQKIGGGLGDVCKQAVSEKIEAKVEHLVTIGVLVFLGLTAVWVMTRPKD
ncbi:MAG: hypothetical protein ACRDPE_18095 [Solirubrobacterales bacterium]